MGVGFRFLVGGIDLGFSWVFGRFLIFWILLFLFVSIVVILYNNLGGGGIRVFN